MGFIGNLAKSFAKKKAEDKITNKEENNSSFITDMIKDFIKDHLKIIILIILGFLILFIIIFGVFSAIFGDDNENKKTTEDTLTLTIGDNGLFKTTASKDGHWFSPDTYKFYAVLDENKFREFISTNGLGDKFGKEESTTGIYEDQEGFLEGNIKSSTTQDTSEDNTSTEEEENTSTENNKLTKKEKEKLMKEYGLLKETIIRIAAASYPEDVIFVLNKTLIFDGDEDSTNQDLIDERINSIIKESDTKQVSGGVSLYRNGSSKKLKYVVTEQELDDAYYTMVDGNVVVKYVETKINTNDDGIPEQEDLFITKGFDLTTLVAPYVMDINFIQGLYARLNSEQFIYYLSFLISQSHIDVGIYENKTNTVFQVSEKFESKIYDSDGNLINTIYTDNSNSPPIIEKNTSVNVKAYIMKVDNWVATINNKIVKHKGDAETYEDTFKELDYDNLIKKIDEHGDPLLKKRIYDRIKRFSNTTYAYDEDKDERIETKPIEEHILLESQTTEYKFNKDKSTVKDNTDYFCGLIRNSTSKGLFSKDVYTPEKDYFEELNAYTINILGDIRDLKSLFHKFAPKGKSMLYVQTRTNLLICPDERLSNEAQRKEFLLISKGRYDETINLIWDKLCGIKVDGKEVLEEIAFRELEAEDINETNLNLKSFIKSMEGTKGIEVIDNIIYHKTYMDSLGIPTTAWGINLLAQFEEFEKYLGDIVYTPAFYTNGFLIPDNIIEKVFNSLINYFANTIKVERAAIGIKIYERDALVYISWWYGNYGGEDKYKKCISEALAKSGLKDLNDRQDRTKLFIYYDYLKKHLVTDTGNLYFNFDEDKNNNRVRLHIYKLYVHGLYCRRDGELYAAETEPLKTALALYQKFIDEGYTYDDNAGFYQKNGNADDSGKYAEAQYNSKELTINDYEYVTWVFKDLGILSQAYTNYESFMEGTLYNKNKSAEDLNKFDIVDNTGENGIPKTIKSRDDLLPGDIVIVKEDDRNSIKIYGGGNNWIEMDNDTLEELKNVKQLKEQDPDNIHAKRKDEKREVYWHLITPIANYKNHGYGDPIDIDNILWVYRNKELANNYIYNDSGEYTNYIIKNHELIRVSDVDPNRTTINSI